MKICTSRHHLWSAQAWITQFLHCRTLQTHHACLCHVSVHQTAPPPVLVIAAIWLQNTLATHLSTPKRMKGWVGLVRWPTVDGLPMCHFLPCTRRQFGKNTFCMEQSATVYSDYTNITRSCTIISTIIVHTAIMLLHMSLYSLHHMVICW